MSEWSPDAAPVSEADRAACRMLIRNGSRTFFLASLLLPTRVREPAYALYAFCRLSDDIVDQSAGRAAGLAELGRRVEALYAQRPVDHAADRALAEVVRRFDVPKLTLEALLEGFAWDLEGRRYKDLASLEAYAVRVAGTVGVMMARLMGVSDRARLARAADLGIAMQLTNIARDVGEDARSGRLYLPIDWLVEAGIDPRHFLDRPEPSPALAAVVARLLRSADAHYRRAEAGIAALPADCRPAIHAARLVYAEIGAEVARNGHDSVTRRAVVPGQRKLALLSRALLFSPRSTADLAAAPAAAARALVEASSLPEALGGAPPWWQVGERVAWVAELFARLESASRETRA